jgi:hypothetical protein
LKLSELFAIFRRNTGRTHASIARTAIFRRFDLIIEVNFHDAELVLFLLNTEVWLGKATK